jgi:hypothetical protein
MLVLALIVGCTRERNYFEHQSVPRPAGVFAIPAGENTVEECKIGTYLAW